MENKDDSCAHYRIRNNGSFRIISVILALTTAIILFATIGHITRIQIGAYYSLVFIAFFAFFVIFFLLFLLRLVFRFIDDSEHQEIIALFLFGVLSGVLLVLINLFRITPNGDSLDDIDTAYYLLNHARVEEDIVHAPFIRAYGNNYFLIVSMKVVFQLFQFLGISDFIKSLFYINGCCIVIAHLFAWLTISRIMNKKEANKFLFLCLINPIYYGLVFWVYSLTFSLPIMTGGLFFSVRTIHSKKWLPCILLSGILGLFVFVGYCLRPTALFPIIACFLSVLLCKKFTKRFLVIVIFALLVAFLLFLGWAGVRHEYFELFESKNLPISYWLTIGSHGNGTLATQNQKDMSLLLNIDPATKMKKGLEIAVEYYKENGIINTLKLWCEKINITWSDGYSGINERLNVGETDSSIFAYIAGDRNQILRLYSQCFRTILLLCTILFCIKIIRNKRLLSFLSIVSVITILGAVLFYVLWEAKNVYSAPFVFFQIIISVDVLSEKPERKFGHISFSTNRWIKGLSFVYHIIAFAVCVFFFFSITGVDKYVDIYIQALYNNRVIIPIEETDYISQEFSIKNSFNKIQIKARNNQHGDQCSNYQLCLLDTNNRVIHTEELDQTKLVEDVITVNLLAQVDAGRYRLELNKTNNAPAAIQFFTQNTYFIDLYDGLLRNCDRKFVSDLIMDISDQDEKPFIPLFFAIILSLFSFALFVSPVYTVTYLITKSMGKEGIGIGDANKSIFKKILKEKGL